MLDVNALQKENKEDIKKRSSTRNSILNPPKFADGMDDDFEDDVDLGFNFNSLKGGLGEGSLGGGNSGLFGGSSGGLSSLGSNGGLSSLGGLSGLKGLNSGIQPSALGLNNSVGFGGLSGLSGLGGMGGLGGNAMTAPPVSKKDEYAELIKILKWIWTFLKEFGMDMYKQFTYISLDRVGTTAAYLLMITGINFIVSLLIKFLMFNSYTTIGNQLGLLIGNSLVSIPTIIIAYKVLEKRNDGVIPKGTFDAKEQAMDIKPMASDAFSSIKWGDNEDYFEDVEDFDSEEDGDFDYSDLFKPAEVAKPEASVNTKKLDSFVSSLNPVINEMIKIDSMDDMLDSIAKRSLGVNLSRADLFSLYRKFLPYVTKDYSEEIEIKEGSDLFNTFDYSCCKGIVSASGDQLTEDDIYLKSLKETKFYYKAEVAITKSKKFKGLREISAAVMDYVVAEHGDYVRVDCDIFKDSYIIKIFKDDNLMISINDMFQAKVVSDYVLDEGNVMPILMGFTVEGKPYFEDFINRESALVAGIGRSGKTWAIISWIYQLAMFNGPDVVQFIIMDAKAGTSDYTYMTSLPHLIHLELNMEKMLDLLKTLVDDEGNRRQKLIGESPYIKIQDYNKAYPEAKLPFIYLVIDEVVTIKDFFERRKQADTYDGYLNVLISKLPALGIRLIILPHRVTNAIISKTLSSLISFKVQVSGSEDDIKNALGVKKVDENVTKRSNNSKGNLALEFGGKAIHVKACVLVATPVEQIKCFNFLAHVWKGVKAEPSPIIKLFIKRSKGL